MQQSGFDSSTLYFAEETLSRLFDPAQAGRIASLLATLDELHVEGGGSGLQDYRKLLKAQSAVSVDGQEKSSGSLFRLSFGLTCVSQVIEHICLADHIYYLTSRELRKTAPWIAYVSEREAPSLWSNYDDGCAAEARRSHRSWVTHALEILTENGAVSRLVAFAQTATLSQPFLYLAEDLWTSSIGNVEHPFIYDAGSQMTRVGVDDYPDFLNYRRKGMTPLRGLDYSVLHHRMADYLLKSLSNDALFSAGTIDYVLNAARAPFLVSLTGARGWTDEKRMIVFLHRVVGQSTFETRSRHEGEPKAARANWLGLLFHAVLAEARDMFDILPAAYRVRRMLDPLREEISKKGLSKSLGVDIENVLRDIAVRDRADSIRVTMPLSKPPIQLQVPISGWIARLLAMPIHGRKKRAIRRVIDQMREAYSISERLSKFHEGIRALGAAPAGTPTQTLSALREKWLDYLAVKRAANCG